MINKSVLIIIILLLTGCDRMEGVAHDTVNNLIIKAANFETVVSKIFYGESHKAAENCKNAFEIKGKKVIGDWATVGTESQGKYNVFVNLSEEYFTSYGLPSHYLGECMVYEGIIINQRILTELPFKARDWESFRC